MRVYFNLAKRVFWCLILGLGFNLNAMTPTEFFKNLNKNTMHLVDEFYAPEAVLVDPMGEIKGSKRIRAYYQHQYQAVTSIAWTTEPEMVDGSQRVLFWTMHLSAPRLNGGKSYDVQGSSRFKLNESGKVVFHQDYFDVGAFVYEKIPVMSTITLFIKNQLLKGVHDFDANQSK